MVTVDGEEWIVHPKVKQKEEPEADYCRRSFGGCKYDYLYNHSFVAKRCKLVLEKLFSHFGSFPSATGIVAILHLLQILEIV